MKFTDLSKGLCTRVIAYRIDSARRPNGLCPTRGRPGPPGGVTTGVGSGSVGGSLGAAHSKISHGTGRACSAASAYTRRSSASFHARRFEPIAHWVPAHKARAHLLASELLEIFALIRVGKMTVARPWRFDFHLGIDRVLCRVDTNCPHVAARVLPGFSGPPRPDRARAIHALDRINMAADLASAETVNLLRVMATRVDADGADTKPPAILGDKLALEPFVQFGPDVALGEIP